MMFRFTQGQLILHRGRTGQTSQGSFSAASKPMSTARNAQPHAQRRPAKGEMNRIRTCNYMLKLGEQT